MSCPCRYDCVQATQEMRADCNKGKSKISKGLNFWLHMLKLPKSIITEPWLLDERSSCLSLMDEQEKPHKNVNRDQYETLILDQTVQADQIHALRIILHFLNSNH